MTASVSQLSVSQMAGITKRPKAFKYDAGQWAK